MHNDIECVIVLYTQHSIGGRVTVVQSCLPNVGPGALKNRDVTPSATKKVVHI